MSGETVLTALGPFRPIPVTSAAPEDIRHPLTCDAFGFIRTEDLRSPEGGSYTLSMSLAPLRALSTDPSSPPELGEGRGRLSKMSRVTLSSVDKASARIPATAISFAFAYPLEGFRDFLESQGSLGVTLDVSKQDALVAFASVGGFVYWDVDDEVCGVNALCEG